MDTVGLSEALGSWGREGALGCPPLPPVLADAEHEQRVPDGPTSWQTSVVGSNSHKRLFQVLKYRK